MTRKANRREFLKTGLVSTVAAMAVGSSINPKSTLAQDRPAGSIAEKPKGEALMETSASYYETPVVYFTKPGPSNTAKVLDCVRRRVQQLNIKTVLVASASGQTALKAREALEPRTNIIAVSLVTGYVEPNRQEMPAEVRKDLISKGVPVLTAQHAFGGVGRGIRKKLGTYQVDEIMAHTLYRFGNGTKVAIELALMAADAGLVRTDEDIISVGGTAKGADTALMLRPANSADFLNLVVKEVICKPAAL